MPIKGRSTQSIVNAFPLWTDIRNDEQSIGFQFVNAEGIALDDLRKQLTKVNDNYFIQTSALSDTDTFYSYQLPQSFEFLKSDTDDTQVDYDAPMVSGIIGDILYPITLASGNDVEGWWYESVPSRISLGLVASGEHYIAGGYTSQSPFSPLTPSGMLHIPNYLIITISGADRCLGVYDNGLVYRGIVQIDGETRQGQKITEEVIFIHNDTLKTRYDFNYVDEIRSYGFESPTSTSLKVKSGFFNDGPIQDNYLLDNVLDGYDIPIFWHLSPGYSDEQYALSLMKYDVDDLGLRIEGFDDKSVIMRQELLSSSGTNIHPLDLSVEPHSDRLWIIDDHNYLHCYDKNFPYPPTVDLIGKNYDSMTKIEIDDCYPLVGQVIEISFTWKRPVQGITKHRVYLTLPGGSKKSIGSDGSIVDYYDDSWEYGEPFNRVLRPTLFYTIPVRGLYVFALETEYADETTSLDKRIVYVNPKHSLCDFQLSEIGIINVSGIDIDSEGKIWVSNNANEKHEIVKYYDNMIIDYEKKVIYFRDLYDKIRVFYS